MYIRLSMDTFTQFPSDGERSSDELNYSGRFTVDYTPDTKKHLSLGFLWQGNEARTVCGYSLL